jgi:hypothetical protein
MKKIILIILILLNIPAWVWAFNLVTGSSMAVTGFSCSETPFFSYTTTDSYTLVGQDHYSNAYVGIQYQGSNTTLCQVDFDTAITGDISGISYIASVYDLDGSNNLSTLRGTSNTLSGASVTNGGFTSFTFSSAITLNTDDVVVVSRIDPTNESSTNILRINYTFNSNATLNFTVFSAAGANQLLLDRALAVRLYTGA